MFVGSNECILMVYTKYLDDMTFYYRFDSKLWWNCWFFIGDNVGFEASIDMGVCKGSFMGVGIMVPIPVSYD